MRIGMIIWSLRLAIAHSGLDTEPAGQAARDAVDALSFAVTPAEFSASARRAALAATITVYGFDGPHDVFNAIRDIAISAELSAMPEVAVQAARDAYDAVLRLFAEPRPPEGDDNPRPHRPDWERAT